MRIKIEITSPGKIVLPVNYQYPMSAMIYRTIGNFNKEYAEKLHNKGFREGRKVFKLFVYSQIFAKKRQVKDGLFIADPPAHFFLSSPDVDFINAFMRGVKKGEINIAWNKFNVSRVEKEKNDILRPNTKYKMLSPCVASLQSEQGTPEYLMPTNIRIYQVLRNNLLAKYKLLHKESYSGELNLSFDFEYINRKNRISRLVTLKEGRRDEIKVRGFLCPVRIETLPTMHQVIRDCGLGSMNSQGFGMLG